MDDTTPDLAESVTVRTLAPADLDRVVAIDAAITGRTRSRWYEGRLARALESDIAISLGAERLVLELPLDT